MSTIEKLSIQGIRSFGPDDSDKQVINFFAPLTLILGPNGTGKTTIIECLKYMTTGLMPPGSGKGGAFIHDPKIAHEREVKGQVRLQFRDITQQQCIVQRSIVATQKQVKVETRTLDGVITRRNAAGEKTSMTSKCADLDREQLKVETRTLGGDMTRINAAGEKTKLTLMCADLDREMITSLGVARPVLDNVIFCHQEDANWPLSEGKQLKEKFDAIFASTRYVKALDTIKKVKKEQDDKLKLLKQDILYLKQHKDKAAQYEGDLAEQEAKLDASKESVGKINTQLKPIEDKLNQIDEKSADIYRVQNNITKLTSEKKQIEKHAEELLMSIENEFQGTDDELKRMLAEFKDKLEERQLTLQEVQEENIQKRDSLIKDYAAEYSFDGFGRGPITDDKYKTFLRSMQQKLESMVENTKELKTDFEQRENEIQKKIDDLRESKTKLEHSEKIKKNMMADNQTKIRQINKKLSEVEASAGRLDQLKRELKRHEHDLQTAESSINVEDIRQEIVELGKEKAVLEGHISDLSAEINQISLQSSAQAQLDTLKKDKISKEDHIRRLKAKQEDTIKHLLGHMPTRNIRGELEEYNWQQTSEVRKCTQEMNDNKNNLSKAETERKMVTAELKKKEEELKGLEEKVYNVCGSQNFDEGLSTIQEKMVKVQDQRGSLLGAQHFFKNYVKDLEKQEPCCPLCHRDFETEQEVRELVLELRKKMQMVPTKLQKTERELDEFQEKYDALLQLKPLKDNMEVLEDQDIPQLKSTLKRNGDEMQRLRTKLTDIEEILQAKESDEAMGKDVHPDIVMMDRFYGEVKELDKQIAVQASKLSGGDSGRTVQMVIDEKDDKQMKVDSITRQRDHKQQKLSDHSEQVQVLRATINSLREEKLGIENDLQQRIKLEEDKVNLESENEAHAQEIKDASERLRPLQTKIDKLREDKEDIINDKDQQIDTAKAEIEVVKRHGTDVKTYNQMIKSYNQAGKADSLEQSRARKEQIDRKLEKITGEQKELSENIDKLRKDLSNQKVRQLELQNNQNLRGKYKESTTLTSQIDDLKEKLGDLDVAHLERERRRLQRQNEEFTRERHTAEGRQRGFEDQIKLIKKELGSDMYKGAAEKYRNKMIDFRTTELANGDLDKYYRAMDKAIMNYHNMKMEEINKIIRELWRSTYKGHDIETIEIRSDEDEAGGIKNRKVYNYRVVMIKPGDTVIDMRGRCSAGQKVLASLIIRLALAETFCLNCGILALDEPTTNLDRENIESLAGALVEIIKGRIHQRNFQLVVITHDEDFVELMGRSDYVEEFFKVRKDSNGCSQLVRARVQELHSR